MKIPSAELVTSASTAGPREGVIRDDLAQFAFAGRSNVGKSSLLNALTQQKLARTSAAAGKTRQANIFRITAEGGFGGPGRPRPPQAGTRLADPERRGAIFLLVDSRHPGLPSDVQAHRWISETAASPHIIATKVDKLSQSERARNLRELERLFGETPLPVSAMSGEGLDNLWRLMAGLARGLEG